MFLGILAKYSFPACVAGTVDEGEILKAFTQSGSFCIKKKTKIDADADCILVKLFWFL